MLQCGSSWFSSRALSDWQFICSLGLRGCWNNANGAATIAWLFLPAVVSAEIGRSVDEKFEKAHGTDNEVKVTLFDFGPRFLSRVNSLLLSGRGKGDGR